MIKLLIMFVILCVVFLFINSDRNKDIIIDSNSIVSLKWKRANGYSNIFHDIMVVDLLPKEYNSNNISNNKNHDTSMIYFNQSTMCLYKNKLLLGTIYFADSDYLKLTTAGGDTVIYKSFKKRIIDNIN